MTRFKKNLAIVLFSSLLLGTLASCNASKCNCPKVDVTENTEGEARA